MTLGLIPDFFLKKFALRVIHFSAISSRRFSLPVLDMAPLQLRDSPSTVDSDAGAAGPSSGSIQISTGALVAVIVGVVCVVIFGSMLQKDLSVISFADHGIVVTSVLFYLAKKRSWEIRKTIRRSAKKVVTALTPRRSTLPKDINQKRPSRAGMARIDEEPPTPGRSMDLEKGNSKLSSFELQQPPKGSKWAKKVGR